MWMLRRGPRVTLSFHFMLVIFEDKKGSAAYGTNNLLVDFSETADNRLCKLYSMMIIYIYTMIYLSEK